LSYDDADGVWYAETFRSVGAGRGPQEALAALDLRLRENQTGRRPAAPADPKPAQITANPGGTRPLGGVLDDRELDLVEDWLPGLSYRHVMLGGGARYIQGGNPAGYFTVHGWPTLSAPRATLRVDLDGVPRGDLWRLAQALMSAKEVQ
jgi:hypothetical protein